jgi:magnesium-transporting ATPase (P-type)
MLFAGTAVANGSCRGVVNAIGMGTEVGAIQQQIADAAAEEEDTPLGDSWVSCVRRAGPAGRRVGAVFMCMDRLCCW